MTKKKLLAPLFLAASFLIVGCSTSEIIARPQWIDDPIVEKDKEKYKDNTLKEIYDAIKKLGDTNANVLNKVMYDIAQQHVGPYEDVDDEHIGLKTILSGTASEEKIKKFIEEHPIYAADKTGFKKGSENPEDLTEEQQRANSLAKIKNQFTRIKEDVCKKLFDEIKGGTYSTKLDKFFEEEYFIEHLYKEMYDVGTYPVTGDLVKDAVFFPKEVESWVNYVDVLSGGSFLHIFKDANGTFTDYYKDYINRKVLPEIYRTLLIETYVREQRETNLGRSYARKINMITVPKTKESYTDTNIKVMLTNFAKDNLIGKASTNLEPIKNAMVGIAPAGTTEADMLKVLEPLKVDGGVFYWKIRTDNNGKPTTEEKDTKVYRGTKLFDIVEKYLKLYNVKYTAPGEGIEPSWKDFSFYPKEHLTSDEQAAYDDLTNKGVYTLEKGLEIKEREIRLTDMTTDGWFLKSTGVSGLDQTFTDRLFNITTAHIIDDETYKKRTDTKPNDTARYFNNGVNAYIFKDKYDSDEDSIILDGDSNFFIVEVQEAASASKLSVDEGKDSYLGLKATDTLGESNDLMYDIVSKITEQVANSDTYKKNAEQYYLMISNIIFYDQSVYDYFKSQFPELFK